MISFQISEVKIGIVELQTSDGLALLTLTTRTVLMPVFAANIGNSAQKQFLSCPHSTRSRVYVMVKHLSVCLSDCPTDRLQQQWLAGLLLSTLWAGDVDQQWWASVPCTSCSHAQQQLLAVTSFTANRGRSTHNI